MRDDFEPQGMKFKVRQTITIEHVPVPRWPAVKRLLRHALNRNWRGMRSAWRVVRTGKDNPYRGVVYGWTR